MQHAVTTIDTYPDAPKLNCIINQAVHEQRG
jgi:hypothetical protein